MIPLKLTIKGLYSYKNEHVIDFTELTGAHLFGIFGAVGSGKSSILDAMMFAMYGQTERLTKHDKRNYNMMNLQSDELIIDFEFQVGKDMENQYRFVTKGKRNKKQFEKINTFERSAYKKEGGEWIPLETTVADEVVGLSYENFKRTIIIPQGRFQEFLTLTETDRTRMLKEIFSLNKYELYDKAASLEKQNNATLQELKGRISQIGEIDGDMIKQKKKECKEGELRMKKLQESLKKVQEKEKVFHKAKEMFEKEKEVHTRLEELDKKKSEMEEREKKMNSYEICLTYFKELLVTQKFKQQSIVQYEKNIGEKKNAIQKLEQQIQLDEKRFSEIKKDFDKKEDYKKMGEEVAKMMQLKQLGVILRDTMARIEKGEKLTQEVLQESEKKLNEKKEKQVKIKDIKSALKSYESLHEVQSWFVEKKHIDENIERLNQQLKELTEALTSIEKDIEEIVKEDGVQEMFPKKRKKEYSLDEYISLVEKYLKKLQKEIEKLEEDKQHLLVQDTLKEYAKELKKGKVCPLCGSKEHKKVFQVKDLEKALGNLEKEINDVKQKKQSFENTLTLFQQKKLLYENKKSDEKKIHESMKVDSSKMVEHEKKFTWKDFSKDDERKVESSSQKMKLLQKELQEKETEFSKLEKCLEELLTKKDTYKTGLDKIKTSYAENKATYKTLISQIVLLKISDYKDLSPDDLQAKKNEFHQKYDAIDKDYKSIEERVVKQKSSVEKLKGEIESDVKTLDHFKKDSEKIAEELQNRLNKYEYASFEEVNAILAKEIDVQEEKKVVELYRTEWNTLNERKKDLAKEMKGVSYDEDTHKTLLDEIKGFEDERQNLNQYFGEIKKEIEIMETAVKEKKEIEKSFKDVEKRAVNITLLKNMFAKSGFVNFVSTMYLKSLCNAANDRFMRLTKQSLQLEIDENNNFQVRDFLNGGQVRSVKTLSGGQTFQAALSLALALADNIQHLHKAKQNFFFLDEGFGSLDKESLHIVFETLKSLRREKRIVGIISHVEELQQEIPVYLKMKLKEGEGSSIERSWL